MKAHSVVTVLPRMTAPAVRNRATTSASCGGTRPLAMGLPYSVGIPAVSITSLMPTGTPCSTPIAAPDFRR